jgi:CDGSH-type Zn-finger protein
MAEKQEKRIIVQYNGPYRVEGDIPLVRKTQVVTEQGEPISWMKEEVIETTGPYELCRCGHSSTKPFCDCTHFEIDFDGTETAPTNTFQERAVTLEGGAHLTVQRDSSICCEAGFCGTRLASIRRMLPASEDTSVRSQIIAMIERCPSGSYTYSIEPGQPVIEPDLPVQIAITTEITEDGPIPGAYWVTGNVPIERSDGQPFETRNRVTLCNCGLSKNKPLCDGTHRAEEQKKLKKG